MDSTIAKDYAYVAGSVNSLLAFTKIKLLDGSSSYTYTVDNPAGISTQKTIANIEIIELAG